MTKPVSLVLLIHLGQIMLLYRKIPTKGKNAKNAFISKKDCVVFLGYPDENDLEECAVFLPNGKVELVSIHDLTYLVNKKDELFKGDIVLPEYLGQIDESYIKNNKEELIAYLNETKKLTTTIKKQENDT